MSATEDRHERLLHSPAYSLPDQGQDRVLVIMAIELNPTDYNFDFNNVPQSLINILDLIKGTINHTRDAIMNADSDADRVELVGVFFSLSTLAFMENTNAMARIHQTLVAKQSMEN